MPRPPRRIEAGVIYHVLNRSNGKRMIFRKEEDFAAFVKVLAEALSRYKVELLAWCVMGNHWHLVLRPGGERELPEFMRWLTVTHVRRHHGHHGQSSGHLYQGRYRCFPVQDDEYFLTLCRYVEANPLRAGLVKQAEAWQWSSLASPKMLPLGDWPVDRPRNWKSLVNAAMEEAQLSGVRKSIERDRPLGSPGWAKRIAARLGLEQTLRAQGRPAKPIELLSPRQRRRRAKANSVNSGQNGK